jgi:hypothetical protein
MDIDYYIYYYNYRGTMIEEAVMKNGTETDDEPLRQG